jgi:sugar lactone lactonase YvrE
MASGLGSLPEMRANTFPGSSRGSTYKVTKGLLYVALSDTKAPYDQVNVYHTRSNNPSPLATITEGVSYPQSVCIDSDGTLYVTNQGSGAGWVSEYPLGKTTPSATITDGISGPGFCAIDGDGNLWVANIFAPDVVEYEKGSTSPHTTITGGIIYPIGIAIDHFGNLYVVNHSGTSGTNVVVYSPKHKSPTRTITDGLTYPEGIGVDAEATLYVTNLIPGTIEEYRVGQSQPYRAIMKNMNGPVAVTFAKNGWFYVSNVGTQGGGSGPAPAIIEFPPGSQKPGKKMITKGLAYPSGTAYYPPLLP